MFLHKIRGIRRIGDVLCIIGDIENGAGYGVRDMGKNKKARHYVEVKGRVVSKVPLLGGARGG